MNLEVIKQQQRRMWSVGDFPDVARTIEPASLAVLEAVGVQPGQQLLDVAAGTGNLAIPAAHAGARVTALDLTPELFDVARAHATEAGVEVEWLEGDAENLPFEDASFDRVTSVFGAMFAPRHEVAAGELVRVTRPGGVFAVTAWTPEGLNGKMFTVMSRAMPEPPPPDAVPPIRWGDEDHVRSLFDGMKLELSRRTVSWEAESANAWVAYTERVLGPTILAKAALASVGRWLQVRAELVELYEEHNQAEDGTLRVEAEYLLAVGRPAG